MSNKGNRPKRSKPSQIYAIASITVVLFVLALLGSLMVNARKLSKQLRENVEVNLMLKDGVKEAEIKALDKRLSKAPYVLSTNFTSKEDAAREFEAEYGEEFTKILGFNPLDNTLSLYLKAEYTQTDSLKMLESKLAKLSEVKEVSYPRNLVHLINDNIRKLSIGLLLLSAIFLFIAITLIDNTIKLSMYSNRFLIKSMQLVGATRQFILKPFVRSSMFNGVISGILASLLLILFLYFINKNLNVLEIRKDMLHYAYICFSVIVIGVLLSYWSTKSAVIKYLKLKLDELY